MAIKKEIKKKKQGQRGKAKPIINVNKKSFEDKIKTVQELEKNLPKENKKKEKNKVGRPTVMTPNVLDKLRLCFSVGMTDEEACYFCGVGVDALYKYQRENEKFIKEKNILKESITMQAKVNIGKSIKVGNVQDSKWWLEKKDKDFINKVQVGGEVKIELTEEQKKKEESLLKKLKNFAVG